MKRHYTLGLYPLVGQSYRKFCWPWWKEFLDPKTYWRTVKYFCQRGYRGYADCDAWDADSYLENVTLGVIKRFKDNTCGFPIEFCDYAPGEEPEGHTETGAAKWDAVLAEIIEGLEASYELKAEDTVTEGVYSDEPLEFIDIGNGFSKIKPLENGSSRFNADLYKQWQAPLLRKRKRAFYLLHKHWGSFWD